MHALTGQLVEAETIRRLNRDTSGLGRANQFENAIIPGFGEVEERLRVSGLQRHRARIDPEGEVVGCGVWLRARTGHAGMFAPAALPAKAAPTRVPSCSW